MFASFALAVNAFDFNEFKSEFDQLQEGAAFVAQKFDEKGAMVAYMYVNEKIKKDVLVKIGIFLSHCDSPHRDDEEKKACDYAKDKWPIVQVSLGKVKLAEDIMEASIVTPKEPSTWEKIQGWGEFLWSLGKAAVTEDVPASQIMHGPGAGR